MPDSLEKERVSVCHFGASRMNLPADSMGHDIEEDKPVAAVDEARGSYVNSESARLYDITDIARQETHLEYQR